MSLNLEVSIPVSLYVLLNMYHESNLFFIGSLVNKNICTTTMYLLMPIAFNVTSELFFLQPGE